MPIAVIAFDFDPFLRIGDRALSLQTLGIAVAVAVALVAAGLLAGRTGIPRESVSPVPREPASTVPSEPPGGSRHLRRDDLLFVVLGIVPGAVVGGRIGYVLLHLDYYSANPGAILDPSQGALQLSLALVGGALTGAGVAVLLEGPVGAWLHVAALPALAGIVLGKVAMALGGAGQGAGWLGEPATAFLGPGPWGSLAPAAPAYPSQLIEAGATFVVVLVAVALLASGRFAARDGRAFFAIVGLWAVARLAVASTWRDPLVLGPLRADQVISLALLAGCTILYAWTARVARRAAAATEAAARGADRSALEWPDPVERRYL